jgi:hypothetical protein
MVSIIMPIRGSVLMAMMMMLLLLFLLLLTAMPRRKKLQMSCGIPIMVSASHQI